MSSEARKVTDYEIHTSMMTVKDVARYLQLHAMSVSNLTKCGVIPGFKVGGQWRFKKDVIDQWIMNKVKKSV